jgi:hypothetical protein
MKTGFLLLPLLVSVAGCTTAFEIGEALNRATTNIANDPGVLWSKADPASAPAASSEPSATPKDEAK